MEIVKNPIDEQVEAEARKRSITKGPGFKEGFLDGASWAAELSSGAMDKLIASHDYAVGVSKELQKLFKEMQPSIEAMDASMQEMLGLLQTIHDRNQGSILNEEGHLLYKKVEMLLFKASKK